MAENSAIEWTDHTVNFWWGCMKVSPGCEHCYAETFSKRVGRNIWGPAKTTERWRTKTPWREILKWDRKAKAAGVRQRVFCQSMSDFFEDHPQVEPWRQETFGILESLEALDVQLLTKRPENVARMVPASWLESWPTHIWMGTSVENQGTADTRIPELLRIPAAVRFLSCEPLLGPIDLFGDEESPGPAVSVEGVSYLTDYGTGVEYDAVRTPEIDWVIVGGESGPGARDCNLRWISDIVEQCWGADVAVFVKQLGSRPFDGFTAGGEKRAYWPITDKKGGDWTLWPDELRGVREFPKTAVPA